MSTPQEKLPPEIDLSTPSTARVYDYFLGGKDNFDVDRALAAKLGELLPDTGAIARDNRAWVRRVVRWLARDAGIDQFLDLGSGLPTAENTHQVAQRFNADAVVVYVDNDPTVIAHGRALLEDNDNTHFIGADLTNPDQVLADPAVTSHLELDRPIAVLHGFTIQYVADQAVAERCVSGYLDRFVNGSYVGVTHVRMPPADSPGRVKFDEFTGPVKQMSAEYTPRLQHELEAMIAGLELVPPGIVPVAQWWPEGPVEPRAMAENVVGFLARKP